MSDASSDNEHSADDEGGVLGYCLLVNQWHHMKKKIKEWSDDCWLYEAKYYEVQNNIVTEIQSINWDFAQREKKQVITVGYTFDISFIDFTNSEDNVGRDIVRVECRRNEFHFNYHKSKAEKRKSGRNGYYSQRKSLDIASQAIVSLPDDEDSYAEIDIDTYYKSFHTGAETFEQNGLGKLMLHIGFWIAASVSRKVMVNAATPATAYILQKYFSEYWTEQRDSGALRWKDSNLKKIWKGPNYFQPAEGSDFTKWKQEIASQINKCILDAETPFKKQLSTISYLIDRIGRL